MKMKRVHGGFKMERASNSVELSPSRRVRRQRVLSAALLGAAGILVPHAYGTPDTWAAVPAGNDFNNAGDWVAGTVPNLTGDSIAFDTSTTTSVVDDLSGLTVTQILFVAGANSF